MTDRARRGRTLVTGSADAGLATELATALRDFVAAHGSAETVVLDFSPGGTSDTPRLDRRMDLPPRAWTAIVDTGSPRDAGLGHDDQHRIARENARLAGAILDGLPDAPEAAFVNDAALPFLAADGDIERLLQGLDPPGYAVLTVQTDTAGLTESLAASQGQALERLEAWADEVHWLD